MSASNETPTSTMPSTATANGSTKAPTHGMSTGHHDSGNKSGMNSASWWPPAKLRDPVGGWKHFAALLYALIADGLGAYGMIQYDRYWFYSDFSSSPASSSFTHILLAWLVLGCAIVLAAHGRIVASYLVHDAAHAAVFVETTTSRGRYYNTLFGTVALWLAGVPYANYAHVRKLHVYHHKDRSDVTGFDYRTFLQSHVVIRQVVYLLEWAHIPAIEIIMHLRTALHPIFCTKNAPYTCTTGRRISAWIGTMFAIGLYTFLWHHGALWPHLVSGAVVLHLLALNDAYQHSGYEALPLTDAYISSPDGRTAAFEEENTFSTIVTTQPEWINMIFLNFGYHNAHHQKTVVPWYSLPAWHNKLYGNDNDNDSGSGDQKGGGGSAAAAAATMPQLLPLNECLSSWSKHKLTRIMNEDYGEVGPPGSPGRAENYIGALGVSFLTV